MGLHSTPDHMVCGSPMWNHGSIDRIPVVHESPIAVAVRTVLKSKKIFTPIADTDRHCEIHSGKFVMEKALET